MNNLLRILLEKLLTICVNFEEDSTNPVEENVVKNAVLSVSSVRQYLRCEVLTNKI